jgi:MATE family multidrug resistance protein
VTQQSGRTELGVIARHAGTVLVGQLATMAFGVTDTIVAGRYAEASLAALSVGAAVFISVFVALNGTLQALLPVWAELRGAGRHAEVGRSWRQALYLCAIAIVLGMAVLLFPAPLLAWAEVPDALRGEVTRYLAVLALALAPSLVFRMYGTLNQALGHPRLVTWLQIGSLVVKVPLSIWFTFGGLGLDAHGAVGCAWATLVVNYLMLAIALWMLRTQDIYRPYRVWQRIEPPDAARIREFARLGIPGGLAILVEVTSFTLMSLFIARQGVTAAASHQIASNLTAVLYMMPMSLGLATSSRVSWWLGAGDAAMARAAVRTGFRLVLMGALLSAGLVWAARDIIASIYSANPVVAATAAGLLGWVALYHLADATQALSIFLLRCYRVTVAPLVVYGVLLWGIGLSGGYVMAYHGLAGVPPRPSPATFWIASAVALALTSLIFVLLLRRAMRHPPAPPRRP